MPSLFVFIVGFISQIARMFVRKMREVKPAPLCSACFHAHVQHGANQRREIFCTYGGVVRPMKLDVLYCTDYRERNLPVRAGSIGFVREIAPAE
jgi:hypothetical protein